MKRTFDNNQAVEVTKTKKKQVEPSSDNWKKLHGHRSWSTGELEPP